MVDITALAQAYFEHTGLPPVFRRAVIAAFEAGYVDHGRRHDAQHRPVPESDDRPGGPA